ncbi:MAG: zinc transporter ZntB [Desulfobulbaceae bacterium]|nr:zinc transporter ZntB [Desulfobulbaceae bacterium]
MIALLIDTAGQSFRLSLKEVNQWQPEDGFLWLHFDYALDVAIDWINDQSEINDVAKEYLLAEDTRPRVAHIKNSLLVSLRGINLNPGSDPEDMIAVRLWADQYRVISTTRRNLLSISEIAGGMEEDGEPANSSLFIVELISRIVDRMDDNINGIEERLADCEEQVIGLGSTSLRKQLSEIRRESLALRRYLAPQREALSRLCNEKIPWMGTNSIYRLREVADQQIRYIEELDSIRDRAMIIHEELVSSLSEQMNARMYVLSLVTVIFLPLGFLTGLFGVNVGGIPGAENKAAFYFFVGILTGLALVLLFFLKRKKWL